MTKLSEQIVALHGEGKSYRQIQEILTCSKGTISYHLGEGQVDKTRLRQRRIRNTIRDYIFETKQNAACADCKENYPYWMMDFDHLGDKKFSVSQYRKHTSNLEKIKEEIAKCDVVCANCHRNRTHLRGRAVPGAQYETGLDLSAYYTEIYGATTL